MPIARHSQTPCSTMSTVPHQISLKQGNKFVKFRYKFIYVPKESIAPIFTKINNSVVKSLSILLYRILYKSDKKVDNMAKVSF